MVRIVSVAAIIVYGLAVLSAALLPTPRPAPATQPLSPDEPAVEPLPALTGIALNVYHTDDITRYLDAVDRIADMGFNALHVVTPAFQRHGASTEITRPVEPGRAPRREDLRALLAHAKQRGLVTVLMPQVNFTEPRGNEWRGKIQPDDWRPWWASYEAMITDFARLADDADVDVFCIGCELLSTQKPEHADRWQRIIEQVRQRHDGALTYSTNWDSYQRVHFWKQLDAIGISAYWDVTRIAADADAPTDTELAGAWQRIRREVLAYAEAQGRPALFTELGYPSLPWALRDPWNYVAEADVPAAPEVQARGYAAFLRAWAGLVVPPRQWQAMREAGDLVIVSTPRARWQLPDPRIAGVLFYLWDPYHAGGPDDTGYGIAGKPAERLVTEWLRNTER